METINKKLTQSEINNIVWKACDSLRGPVDPTEYKDYVLTMLFFKYLSDVWETKKQEYNKKYNNDAIRVERALKNERFTIPDGCTFQDVYEQRNKTNIGQIINMALTAIEDANSSKLEGISRRVDFNNEAKLGQTEERNRRLHNVLNDFNSLDLHPEHLENNDVIGDAYEYLIAKFADSAGKSAGEFYTPAEVSTLLAKLVEPKPGNRIYDPTCGSGSLLIKVAREVGSQNFSLFGQEVNGSTYALAKMNMFLHGFDSAKIEWGDTINYPKLTEGDTLMKFNIVVANPPFSLDKWGAELAAADKFSRFHRGVPPKSKGDYAFISHMVESMYEGMGRMGVIVPHGVLFRGAAEGTIRKKFIDENILEAVIGLPANLFFGTGIPAAILLFNKGKGENTDVLFIDASKGFESGKNQNKLRLEDIDKIVATVKAFRNEDSGLRIEKTTNPPSSTLNLENTEGGGYVLIDKYAYRASIKDILENDYNLNIPRYVDTFEEEEEIDIAAAQQEIKTLKTALAEAETQMESFLKELGF